MEKTDYAIQVAAQAFYLEEQSNPEQDRYVFAYTIVIQNHGNVAARLLNRHWIITDANGKIEEVRGEGVVGEQPLPASRRGFSSPAAPSRRPRSAACGQLSDAGRRRHDLRRQHPAFRAVHSAHPALRPGGWHCATAIPPDRADLRCFRGAVHRDGAATGLVLLPDGPHAEVLLVGVGSGLDLPLLPRGPRYTGLDLTPAMLARARRKATALKLDIKLDVGDARRLPYGDATFDVVVLHLILAVTPHPERVLIEAARVLRRGGRVLILDRFLRLGQKAPLRRLISRCWVCWPPAPTWCSRRCWRKRRTWKLLSDQPALANGWFRRIVLRKTGFHDGHQIHHHRPNLDNPRFARI